MKYLETGKWTIKEEIIIVHENGIKMSEDLINGLNCKQNYTDRVEYKHFKLEGRKCSFSRKLSQSPLKDGQAVVCTLIRKVTAKKGYPSPHTTAPLSFNGTCIENTKLSGRANK